VTGAVLEGAMGPQSQKINKVELKKVYIKGLVIVKVWLSTVVCTTCYSHASSSAGHQRQGQDQHLLPAGVPGVEAQDRELRHLENQLLQG